MDRQLVCRLPRFFRSMWCRTCVLCIWNTPCLIFGATCRNLAARRCKEEVAILDVNRMLVQSCGEMSARVVKYTTLHKIAGMECAAQILQWNTNIFQLLWNEEVARRYGGK